MDNKKISGELNIANNEIAFLNQEKENRATELKDAYNEIAFQIEERGKRAAELVIANIQLVFENDEKEKRAAELIIANNELAFQNEEKHKRAQELLNANKELDFLNKNQQALFASIVNSSDDAMLSKTLDGIITSWNYGAEKIFGYSAEEIIGKNVLTLIPPQLQQEEADIAKKIQNGETVDHHETKRIRKDGATFNASLNVSPIRNFEGNIVGASKVLMDITNQKEKERHLKLLESVITNTKDSVMITEAEPFDEPGHRIVFVNEAFTKMTGYSSEEVINKTPRILQGPKSDKAALKRFSEAIRKWQPCEITTINYKKNGKEYWVNFSVSPVANEKGCYTHWISIERDVTAQKLTEIQLNELNKNLQNNVNKLVISNEELEQFAYVASHDLKEPLRMVTSFLGKLEQKYERILDDKGKQYIYYAVDGAVRMRQIIEDLLKFSQVGRNDEQLENIDLNVLVDGVLKLLSKQIIDKKAVFNIKKLPTITFYKSPLFQIFQNLISNTLKYTNVDVSPQISIACKENESDWEISVADNGIGISDKFFDKIFILFQRLHNKNEYSGTGIGLAIAKKIIDKYGGKIWVESEEGKGSTFYFTIKKY